MKKIVYLLAALIPALSFTSCDDNDDVPDVDFNVTFSKAQFADDQVYVVQGDTIDIQSVEAINNEQGKGVTIPYVNYYFDGIFVGQNPIAPYGFDIVVPDNVIIGKHTLQISCPVFAVDKAPGYAVVTYTVNVVQSDDDIPSDAVQTVITTANVTQQSAN